MRKELLELVIEYLEGRIRRGEVCPETLAGQRRTLLRFALSHGGRPLEQLGKATINHWAEDMAHVAPSTKRQRVSTIRHFLGWAHDEHAIPDLRKHLPKVGQPRTVPRARTREEVATLLANLPNVRARAVVGLLLYPGLRAIEVSRLKVEDYDRGMLRVTGKSGHERIIPVGTRPRACPGCAG
jgi:site-specific recombinase XerD